MRGYHADMADIELIGVPFDGYGRDGHQAKAAGALRAAGLLEAFEGHRVSLRDVGGLPNADSTRGRATGLLNEPVLLALTAKLNERVGIALHDNRFPVVYGGDCAVLLGIATGLRDHGGGVGLLFVDGHEDTMPLDVSEDGEAANAELGLLLGLTGRLLTGPLAEALPAVERDLLAVLGPRDVAWRNRFNVGSLRDVGVWFAGLSDVRVDAAESGRAAVGHIQSRSATWWLHVDLDVLDPREFGAQGLPDYPDEPGGLTWSELTDALRAALAMGGCVGLSLVIYDPDQDATGRDGRRIVQLVNDLSPLLGT